MTHAFLDPSSAVRLGRTSKKLYEALGLKTTRPFTMISSSELHEARCRGVVYKNESYHKWIKLPVVDDPSLHSVTVAMEWMCFAPFGSDPDGGVCVVAERDGDADESGQNSRRVVCQCRQPAQYRISTLQYTFRPRSNETYWLFYRVGSGGRQSLKVKDVRISFLFTRGSLQTAMKFFSLLDVHPWDSRAGNDRTIGKLMSWLLADEGTTQGHSNATEEFFRKRGIDNKVKALIVDIWRQWKKTGRHCQAAVSPWFKERVCVRVVSTQQRAVIREVRGDTALVEMERECGTHTIRIDDLTVVVPSEDDTVLVTRGEWAGIEGELVCIDGTDAILREFDGNFRIVDLVHLVKIETTDGVTSSL